GPEPSLNSRSKPLPSDPFPHNGLARWWQSRRVLLSCSPVAFARRIDFHLLQHIAKPAFRKLPREFKEGSGPQHRRGSQAHVEGWKKSRAEGFQKSGGDPAPESF